MMHMIASELRPRQNISGVEYCVFGALDPLLIHRVHTSRSARIVSGAVLLLLHSVDEKEKRLP